MPLLTSFVSCLDHRVDASWYIYDIFGILLNVESEDFPTVRKRADALSASYPSDLDQNLADEIIQFRYFIESEQDKSPQKLLQLLWKHGLQSTFPNVFVALHIFLTLPVTNSEGEISFSKMARIKNELRTTQTQKHLSALSLMAIESQLVMDLDFDDIATQFANR